MFSTDVFTRPTTKTAWKPSPHVLIRFAGKSYEELDRLKFRQTVPVLDEIIALRTWVKRQKDRLCDELLYAEIGKHSGKTRGQLVALKRNIFNERAVPIAERQVLRTIGNATLRYEVLRYYRQLLRLERRMKQGRDLFTQELAQKRRLLQESFRDADFQKGIQLATPSLFAGLQHYLEGDAAAVNGRDQRTEAGAFRYFARMTAKTSPFGRFGPLALAAVQPESEQLFSIRTSGKLAMRSETSLNLSVVADLATSLSRIPEFQAHLQARVNYTYYLDGDEIVFLRPKLEDDQPVYTSMNSVRRGKYLPIMRQVVEFLEANKQQLITLNDVIHLLTGGAATDSAAYQKAAAFVYRLVHAGLILTDFQLPSNTRDRLSYLREQVEALDVPQAAAIGAKLQQLQENCQRFAQATVTERVQIHEETQQIINELMQWWRPPAEARAERTDYFMEDAVFADVQMQLGAPFFAPLAEDLGPFLECIHARDQGGLSHLMLRDIFVSNFGVGGSCHNLMLFALEHMRIMMNTMADRELDNKELFPRSAASNERALAYMKAFGNDETPTARREIVLPHETLHALTEEFGGQLAAPLSSALNVQIAAESWEAYERGDYLVAFNYALPGFGHFFTRYCYLFDNDPNSAPLTENLRQ
ncbi:MAG: lantibiotic dehydratase, partial [Anaerolineales bacterium]|nr:lantibiotic dehydratase [Anaerolineales bacterium]